MLSCIDLRLTDNLLEFLHFDNLTNRYDHFALAGTSLLTQVDHPDLKKLFDKKALDKMPGHKLWKQTWIDHLNIAIELHRIEDIYIIEHEDCGAYKTFLKKQQTKSGEYNRHADFAMALATDSPNRPA